MPSEACIERVDGRHQSVVLRAVGGVEQVLLRRVVGAYVRQYHSRPRIGEAAAEHRLQQRDGMTDDLQCARCRNRQFNKSAPAALRRTLLEAVGHDEYRDFAAEAVLPPQLLGACRGILRYALVQLVEGRGRPIERACRRDAFLGGMIVLEVDAGLCVQLFPHAKTDQAHVAANPLGRHLREIPCSRNAAA